MAEIKIKIKNLYKVFGKRPDQAMPLVRQGVTKQELLDEHQHVLGLSDINIDIPDKRIHVNGIIRLRQINFDSTY